LAVPILPLWDKLVDMSKLAVHACEGAPGNPLRGSFAMPIIKRLQRGSFLSPALVGLVKSDAVEEVDEARIGSNRIKEWKHLQRLQQI
jgi:hypothetical protein